VLKLRIIPILTWNGFALVKTKHFANPRMVGNAVQAARVYNSRGVDELFFLDISATAQRRKINTTLVSQILRECAMPVAVGGGITTLDDISALLNIGADKVVLKTCVLEQPGFLAAAAKRFGSQALCVAVDTVRNHTKLVLHAPGFREWSAAEFVAYAENEGAGELCITSVDHEGALQGFDCEGLGELASHTGLPVVAAGGAGEPRHFLELIQKVQVQALAAASIYHFTQYTPNDIKRLLRDNDLPIRYVAPGGIQR
jgi:cyclase